MYPGGGPGDAGRVGRGLAVMSAKLKKKILLDRIAFVELADSSQLISHYKLYLWKTPKD